MANDSNKQETALSSAATLWAARLLEAAKRRRRALGVFFTLLIAAAAISGYLGHAEAAREREAEEGLFRREVEFMRREMLSLPGSGGGSAEELDRAIREYAGLPAGGRALLLKFGRSFNLRDYAAAEEAARGFLRLHSGSSLAPRARLALAQALIMRDSLSEAETLLRDLARTAGSDLLPASKLALAQLLERRAESAGGNPDEYRRLLEAAEEEYNDIIVRSRIGAPAQRGFWPQAVVLPAEFSLAVIRDKLAGYRHPEPGGIGQIPETPGAAEGAEWLRPPPDSGAAEPAEGAAAEYGPRPADAAEPENQSPGVEATVTQE